MQRIAPAATPVDENKFIITAVIVIIEAIANNALKVSRSHRSTDMYSCVSMPVCNHGATWASRSISLCFPPSFPHDHAKHWSLSCIKKNWVSLVCPWSVSCLQMVGWMDGCQETLKLKLRCCREFKSAGNWEVVYILNEFCFYHGVITKAPWSWRETIRLVSLGLVSVLLLVVLQFLLGLYNVR